MQRRARKHQTLDLVILSMPGRASTTRLGITVSRKVAKQAVRRNRIKRFIRESFRRLNLENAPALDIAVIARPRAVRASHQSIQQQLESFWKGVTTPPGERPGSPG